MNSSIRDISIAITPVLKKYDIKRASIFGSFADGTATEHSDIDILVELTQPIGLLQFIHIKHEMEDVLGKKVDLLEYKAIKASLKQYILDSAIQIYGKEAA